MPREVHRAVAGVEGVRDVAVELVWDPPWTSERMSEDARMTLEMLGISWRDHRPGGPAMTPLTFRRPRP
jgi:metal-sulfur cluster biosynthetic enzyme